MTSTTHMAPALELTGIDMHYGFVRALDSVSLHVNPGEIVGLLGDNGAGKSTLVKTISGIVAPDSGEICVAGQRLASATPAAAWRWASAR